MKVIWAVATNTFRETVRERVLYNLVFFAIVMTVCGAMLQQISIRQDQKIIKDLGLAGIDIFGSLIAMFIGVGLVSKEIERRSLYPLLAKPLTRDQFLVGKFLGLCITLAVNVAGMTAATSATLWATSGRPDVALLKGVLALYAGLVLTVALSLLFSSQSSTVVAAVCTFGVVMAGRYSDVVRNMGDVVASVPGWTTTLLYYVLPNFRNFDIKNRVVYGDPVGWDVLAWIYAYAAVYSAVVLGLAVGSFRRRELQ
jgi:ABC-type transport system involved in multi-copper enzyme maturation permease subunit